MCSIIGYIGKFSAASVLVGSLKKMEYRGYDSVGIATLESNKILIRKGVGKVLDVDNSLHLYKMPGQIGIGHTRWATHGGISKANAHPHTDCDNNVVVVHNGIIDNYLQLKDSLIGQGHIFQSQTDSEVIAHLIETYLKKFDIKQAIIETCKQIHGSYAFVAIFKSGIVAGARLDEPLIIGIGNNGNFISSDVLGFLEYTDKAIFLDNHDIVILEDQNINLFDFNGHAISRPITQVAWELGDLDKGKYAHYTIKEIHEQKNSIPVAFQINRTSLKRAVDIISSSKNIFITGSGTSFHSALLAKYLFYKFAKIRTEIIMSSEFEYVSGPIDENSLLIAISQSGETADVLNSVKIAKQHKAKILSIVNISTSSLCRLSDHYVSINCGPEIGVAATKSFTAQLAVIYSIIDNFCTNTSSLELSTDTFSNVLKEILKDDSYLEKIAEDIKSVQDIYILGTSFHYPIALEGALKIKELAYIHAEGIAAGEIKHGPLALIEPSTIVIVLNPEDETYHNILNSINEMKSRGAKIIGISNKNNDLYDYFIKLPLVNKYLYPIIEIIPLQILSYYLAIKKNANPDYPRNLAKSVTVK
ncbi:MAG TPA: glutamine--fructose-6-phosphate transaminase (isomerizing) [Nitrososphaeraceae archaeon]|nr:glutamine--fructose-6-phosphate transaminase (isomerizing) [Nitrososphaeraceae archaeon]